MKSFSYPSRPSLHEGKTMQTVKVQLPVAVDGVEAAGQPAPRFWLWTSFWRANTALYNICIDENGKRMKLRGLGQIRGVGGPATGLAETAQQAWLEEQHRMGPSGRGIKREAPEDEQPPSPAGQSKTSSQSSSPPSQGKDKRKRHGQQRNVEGGGGGAPQVGDGLTVSELRAVVGRAVSESVSEVVPEDTQDAMSALVGLPDRLEMIVKEAAKGKASKAEADRQQKGRIVELEAQVRTLQEAVQAEKQKTAEERSAREKAETEAQVVAMHKNELLQVIGQGKK